MSYKGKCCSSRLFYCKDHVSNIWHKATNRISRLALTQAEEPLISTSIIHANMTKTSSDLADSLPLQRYDRTAKEWRPAYYISNQHRQDSVATGESVDPYAVLILNQPISNRGVFSEVCCGGENKLPPSLRLQTNHS